MQPGCNGIRLGSCESAPHSSSSPSLLTLLSAGGAAEATAKPAASSCDPIDPANCLLPWPNDHFTQRARTPTGRRLSLSAQMMPRNKDGVPIEPV